MGGREASWPRPLQLEAYYAGEDPASVAGSFGSHSLYKNLGYFSLIGLLRLHCQLGDYYLALKAVANVQLSKKVGAARLSWWGECGGQGCGREREGKGTALSTTFPTC